MNRVTIIVAIFKVIIACFCLLNVFLLIFEFYYLPRFIFWVTLGFYIFWIVKFVKNSSYSAFGYGIRPKIPSELLLPKAAKKYRFVCISDTHGNHESVRKLPPGDVLLHSGDVTRNGRTSEFLSFLEWFSKQPYEFKIFIPGNHDICLDPKHSTPEKLSILHEKIKQSNVTCLMDTSLTLPSGIKIHGCPWSIRPWKTVHSAFQFARRDRKRAHAIVEGIPKCDVLMTHSPPFGVMDKAFINRKHVGMREMAPKSAIVNSSQREVVVTGDSVRAGGFLKERVGMKVHVFGHIHEGYGVRIIDGIKFINASVLTLFYKMRKPAIVFDLPIRDSSDSASQEGD